MLMCKQAPNVIIPCFRCMLILLLNIVCLSDSKQICFRLLVNVFSKDTMLFVFSRVVEQHKRFTLLFFFNTLVRLLAYVSL